jgi:hypothetical protein
MNYVSMKQTSRSFGSPPQNRFEAGFFNKLLAENSNRQIYLLLWRERGRRRLASVHGGA